MSGFLESIHCKSRLGCRSCRMSTNWRSAMGAPDVCPFGITLDSLQEQVVLKRYSSQTDNIYGPGSELKALLKKWLGVSATTNCSCNAHAAQMDKWGPDECERHLQEIVGWLKTQASDRGLPFSQLIAEQIIRLAIRRARKVVKK